MKPYYEKDGITIYHGSCYKMVADVIFLDPPYLIGDFEDYQFNVLYILCGGDFQHYQERLVPRELREWWWKCRHCYDDGEYKYTNEPLAICGEADPANHSPYYLALPFYHTWQRPVELMFDLISCTEGDVLDPFMGSGTTLVAAKTLKRKCVGYDLEEECCEIAAKRLEEVL